VRSNSVLLDDSFVPYPDQWAFFSSIQRVSCGALESLVGDARRRGDLIGMRIRLGENEGGPDP
jgi:hypothetical protein